MSTQIHNGWKFPEGTTLDQAFAVLHAQGRRLRQVANEKAHEHVLHIATRVIDEAMAHCLGVGATPEFVAIGENDSPLGHAFGKMIDLTQAKNSTEANYLSTAASVVIAAHDTGLYALTYFRNRDMEAEFVDQVGLREFGYWNNTDPPEGMDEEQWEARGAVWDEILGETSVPSHAGATFEMVRQGEFLPWMAGIDSPDEVSIMPMEKRVWRVASDSPHAGLNAAKSPGEAARLARELRENPSPEFVALCDLVRQSLPDPIPGKWLKMKRPELIATCQERLLQQKTNLSNALRSGPRI